MSSALDQAYFKDRPQRFDASAIFSNHPPKLFIGDIECRLKNLSQNGVGCQALADNDEFPGSSQDLDLQFRQLGQVIHTQRASIARVDHSGPRPFLGIALRGSQFELNHLRVANARALASPEAAAQLRADIPTIYKSFCADVLAFIGHRLEIIDRHISPIESDLSEGEKDAIAEDLHDRVKAEWLRLMEQGNDCVIPFHSDADLRRAMKLYTEHTVTPLMIDGASWRRSYCKPLGYPGDYQIMNFMYDANPIGATVRSRFLHLIGLTSGQLIVSRMNSLLDLLADQAWREGANTSESFKVLSVGSGPAREMEPLARRIRERRGLDVTLVDSEPLAIDYSSKALTALQNELPISFEAFNISFQDILKERYIHKVYDHADVIYSSGMLDYLGPLTAKRYISRLYREIKPGGRIMIGNVNNKRTGALWVMEYALDWGLFFRDEAAMRALGEGLEGATVSIEEDATKSVYFLIIDKPH